MKSLLSFATSGFLGVAMLLTACAQQGPQPSTGADGTPQGGEFRVNMAAEPDTIDPNRSNFATSILVASKVFDGLFTYDKDLQVIPAVAKEMPTVGNGGISSDGKTFTIKLRTDTKWSDGQPVTAKDFVYAIKRSLDPKLAAPYATSLYDIDGARAYNTAMGTKEAPKQASDAELATMRDQVAVAAPDSATLVVRLAAPRPSFLQLLALWVAWPVREDIVTKFGDKWTEPPNYIGNGPFILSNWSHQEKMEFAPNPNYYGQKPNISKLTLLQITDANQAYLAYQNGELDAVSVPDANVKVVQGDETLAKQALQNKELTVFGYQFNTKVAPFDNVKVRQAFAMAVDRKALIDKVAQGIGNVAYSVMPPGMPGYDVNLGKDFDLNAAKAKQLLNEAGYSDPSKLQITFSFADTSSNRLRAEFFQGQIKQNLGVDVTLEVLDARTFAQRFNASQFMVAFAGWGADYPDPDNFVPNLFLTGSSSNKGGYANPLVDIQARLCQSELDQNRRMAACAQAQRLVVADQPWIFLFYRESFWLVKPYVKGFQTSAKDRLVGDRFYHQIAIEGK